MNTNEPTVLDELEPVMTTARPGFERATLKAALQAVGLDPYMSVARLRADLAIAQRAREFMPVAQLVVHEPDGKTWSRAGDVLRYVLQIQTVGQST